MGTLRSWLRDAHVVGAFLLCIGFWLWGAEGSAWVLEPALRSLNPRHAWMIRFGFGALVMGLVPVLVLKFGYRRSFDDLGLGLGKWRAGVPIALVAGAAGAALMFFVTSKDASVRAEYPLCGHAALTTGEFVAYELAYLGFFVGGELALRGVLLFSLREKLGSAALAVLVTTAIQIVWHTGKPLPELLAAPVWGLAVGALTLRLESAWYALFFHWVANVALDAGILYGI